MKNKNKTKKRNLYIFGIIVIIFLLFLIIILPKFLYGKNLLFYYIQHDNYDRVSGVSNKIYAMPDILNYKFMIGRFLSFVLIVCYISFIFWIRKNIKGNRKVIYPIMYLILLFIIYFTYLSFVKMWISDSLYVLTEPINNALLSNFLFEVIFIPFNPLNFMFAALVKIGDIIDFKSSKSRKKKMISNIRILEIASIIFVVQVLFMILFVFVF